MLNRTDDDQFELVSIHEEGEQQQKYNVKQSDALNVHPSSLKGLPDLLKLEQFHEGSLLHTVRQRYAEEQIYTRVGASILISMNPYT